MSYTIKYDEKTACYEVQSDVNHTTKLVIKPHELKNSWIAIEYNDMYDEDVTDKTLNAIKHSTFNEVVDTLDVALVVETSTLADMLKELAKLIEEGKHVK